MRKFKYCMMALAMITGILVAFTTRPRQLCAGYTQYYYKGGLYFNAGVLGENYYCENASGTCTYFWNTGTNSYQPCQTGEYQSFSIKLKKAAKQ
jgi:hypothetical protein